MPANSALHPATAQLLEFFDHEHLPPHLRSISAPIGELANALAVELSGTAHGAELTTGLRKLLEAKDCFVRARLGMPTPEAEPTAPIDWPEED